MGVVKNSIQANLLNSFRHNISWRWVGYLFAQGFLLYLLFHAALSQSAALQWDATEIYLPWKYFVTEQWKYGFLPLWNPYMSGGFPQHGDPGTWYELSYFFAINGVYDLQSLLWEFLFHLMIASFGMRFLLKRLNIPDLLATTIGFGFALNGFFMGNAQHMGWVIGFAWLPWLLGLLLALLRFGQRPESILSLKSVTTAALLGLVAHFQFVGGYLGVTAIALYAAVFLIFYWLWATFRSQKAVSWMGVLVLGFLSILVFIGLSLPALLSFYDLQSLITRSERLSLGDMQFGHWPIQALSTMWFDVVDAQKASKWGSDISLLNVRWSFLLMACLLVIILRQNLTRGLVRIKYLWAVLGASILCFLLATGFQTPIHGWVIPQLPLLKLFRFPAIYRGLGLMLLFIASAWAISPFWKDKINIKWKWVWVLLLLSETMYGSYRDLYNTVLVKIPANEVNTALQKIHNHVPKPGEWYYKAPRSMPVDADSNSNATVPFMNQNQGVYLHQWATDGYNPYQFKSKEMRSLDEVHKFNSDFLMALDSNGTPISEGVLSVRQIRETGQFIEVRDIEFSSRAKTFVLKQTPSKHWKLKIEGQKGEDLSDLPAGFTSWKPYGAVGVEFKVCKGFRLDYSPSYLSNGVLESWKITWLILVVVLIINGIPQWRLKSSKKP